MSTPKRTVLNVTSLKTDGKKSQSQQDEDMNQEVNSQPPSQEWPNNHPPLPTQEWTDSRPPPPTQGGPQISLVPSTIQAPVNPIESLPR